MFVSRDNFSTVYTHEQHRSSTVFDMLVSFKPSNRFDIIIKHIPVSVLYTYMKYIYIGYQKIPPYQILLNTSLLILPWTNLQTNVLRKGQNTDRNLFVKINLLCFRSLLLSVQYSKEYHKAAFVHQCLRKEFKKPQFNPLPLCFWGSFAAANHIHQSYLGCAEQGIKKVACILHILSKKKANTHFWKARSKSFK